MSHSQKLCTVLANSLSMKRIRTIKMKENDACSVVVVDVVVVVVVVVVFVVVVVVVVKPRTAYQCDLPLLQMTLNANDIDVNY